MKTFHLRRWGLLLTAGAFAVLSGCVMATGGYDDGVGAGVDYYDTYGYDYGGWGPDYFVGPVGHGGHHFEGRGGHEREERGGRGGEERGGHGREHSFRSAPASRSMPSLPAQSRSGGRSGGGGSFGGGRGERGR